jgi:hypothetical protein
MALYSEPPLLNETIYPISDNNNYKTYSIIWLDASINSQENNETQGKLRSFIDYLQIFENVDQCEKHIQSVSSGDRIIFVVSGDLGQQLIPKIHPLEQIFSIYIYCANKEFHQQWTKEYKKVILIFGNSIIDRISI